MKPDDFEKHLQRQPLRRVPSQWRDGVLWAARQAAAAQPAPRPTGHALRAILATINSQLSTLLWPHPAAWAGLAAAWALILGFNLTTHDAALRVANRAPSASPDVFMAFQEQQRLLTELIGPRETPVADQPKSVPPLPRSERRSGLLMA
ncbi:MAG: hypothetical protein ACLQU3_16200 [Limisphaerales bacterium]